MVQGAVRAAYKIALEQGLIADGSESYQGILFAGRFVEGHAMFVALVFYIRPDGGLTFEFATHSRYPDWSACATMQKKFTAALSAQKPQNG